MRKYRNIPAMSSGAYDTVSDGIPPPTQTRNYDPNTISMQLSKNTFDQRSVLLNSNTEADDIPVMYILLSNISGRHVLEKYFKKILQILDLKNSSSPFKITLVVLRGRSLLQTMEIHNKRELCVI